MRHRLAFPVAVALLAGGCSAVPERRPEPVPLPAQPTMEMIQAGQLARYAADLQVLVQGNATAQAEAIASARAGYDQAKVGPAALRYGLMLAAPAHPQRDARLAQHVLTEALSHTELLTPPERALGAVELARMDAELRLVNEIDRLVAERSQESERQRATSASTTTALNKRLQTEIEESAHCARRSTRRRPSSTPLHGWSAISATARQLPKDAIREPDYFPQGPYPARRR
jgi:hypothetical protein